MFLCQDPKHQGERLGYKGLYKIVKKLGTMPKAVRFATIASVFNQTNIDKQKLLSSARSFGAEARANQKSSFITKSNVKMLFSSFHSGKSDRPTAIDLRLKLNLPVNL